MATAVPRRASRRHVSQLLAATVLAAGAIAACGDDANDGAGDEVVPTGVVVPVVALDNSFRPETVEIGVGDEVRWENRGINDHDVLSIVGDEWGIEVEGFAPGDVYAHVFDEPGEYRYYCSIHGNQDVGMVGTVIVSA